MTIFTYPDAFNPVDAEGNVRGADMGEANVTIRELMTAVQMALFDGLVFSTRAALYADLAHAENSWAIVIGDPTAGYDGLYRKSGASGAGSWSRVGDVPGSGFIKATDAGAGTANAIVATSPAIPATDGAALIALNIFETNTASPVTVAFNGGSALTIKTNAGNDVATGGLTAGMIVTGYKSGTTFRLLSDQASAAILAAAEAAQAAAEDARDEAVAAASSVQAVRDSRADAIANYHPIVAPNFIHTAGYATAGDGGTAIYKKVVSEPSHAGKLSITLDGGGTTWYELVPDQAGLNPLALGVVMGATIDVNDVASLTNYADTTALAAATIGGSVEAIKVNGEPWRRIDENHPRLGPDMIVNGNMSSATGYLEAGDTSVFTIGSNVVTVIPGGQANLYQTVGLANGDKVFVAFRILSRTAGGLRAILIGSNNTGPDNTTTGVKTTVLAATALSTGVGIYSFGTFNGQADDLSARKLPADAVQSADGAWWAAADLRYAPVGTGAVTGTDSLAAVVAAQAVSEALKVPILWPSGDIRILIPDGSQQKLVQYGEWGLHWRSAGRTRFILDDNPAYTATAQTGNIFIASAQTADYTRNSRNINKKCILEHGIVIQGTWWRDIEKGGRSWTGAALPYRCHAVWPTHTQTVRLDGAEIYDIMGFATNTRSCGQVIYTKSKLGRIAGDGFRAEDCDNVQIFGNHALHVDDNVVALPDLDDLPNYAGPRRAGASVTGNIFESCRGVLVLGPAALDISHNILRRMYGGGIAAYTQASDVADRGEGGFRTVTISHNLVEDVLKESALADPPDGTWSTDTYALSIRGGTPATPTGTGTGTPATLPYASTTQSWGAMHVQDMTGADAVAGFRGAGMQCRNNTLMRTHQGGSYYTCMGYGKRFTRWGFDNPAIGDTEFALGGIQLRGDFQGATVAGNIIQNFPLGAGIYLARTTVDMAFRNTLIARNTIVNVRHGIDCDAVSAQYQGISIVGNIIDVDPYRIQPERAAGNKWTGGFTGAAPACIHLSLLRGLFIAGNHFKNAANPWTLEGGAIEAIQYNTLRDNIGYVDIGTGSSATTTDSKFRGLGRIPFAGPMMTYRIQDLDPASGTFEQDQAGMLTYSVAMPTSGKYVVGHLITTNAGIYLRYLTGDAHVLNTDWKLM